MHARPLRECLLAREELSAQVFAFRPSRPILNPCRGISTREEKELKIPLRLLGSTLDLAGSLVGCTFRLASDFARGAFGFSGSLVGESLGLT